MIYNAACFYGVYCTLKGGALLIKTACEERLHKVRSLAFTLSDSLGQGNRYFGLRLDDIFCTLINQLLGR